MKPIDIKAYIPQLMESIHNSLLNMKTCDTKVNVAWDISTLFKAATNLPPVLNVEMTADAWTKMMTLVHSIESEAAWHMVVDKLAPDQYRIEDVLVYPQDVSGTSADSNDEEYHKWLETVPDDVYARMRGHGHSHVHMGVSPSGPDIAFQQTWLSNLKDHYLFLIVNKKADVWLSVYDVVNNVVYEKSDIVFRVIDRTGQDIDIWTTQAKKFLVKYEPPPSKKAEPYGYTMDSMGRPLDATGVVKAWDTWTEAELDRYNRVNGNRFTGFEDRRWT